LAGDFCFSCAFGYAGGVHSPVGISRARLAVAAMALLNKGCNPLSDCRPRSRRRRP